MKTTPVLAIILLLTALALPFHDADVSAKPVMSGLPNPVLYLQRQEAYTAGGRRYIRYVYSVENRDAYPNEMFAAAPTLPPCGANTNSSRSWIDLFDQTGTRLYGFCALSSSENLNGIWFAMEEDAIPPSYIYIEITDRQTNTKYRSNLADTTM
jgi:hypothetical protein